jgi:hypothetical protein
MLATMLMSLNATLNEPGCSGTWGGSGTCGGSGSLICAPAICAHTCIMVCRVVHTDSWPGRAEQMGSVSTGKNPAQVKNARQS